MDIAEAVAPGGKREIVGIRPGEKLHEQMISPEDAPHTYDYGDHYRILPAINNWAQTKDMIGGGVKVPDGFTYASDSNRKWMSVDTLRAWIEENRDKVGAI
jgi:FlaA1/EpsC-like NDP-sugar epimerase